MFSILIIGWRFVKRRSLKHFIVPRYESTKKKESILTHCCNAFYQPIISSWQIIFSYCFDVISFCCIIFTYYLPLSGMGWKALWQIISILSSPSGVLPIKSKIATTSSFALFSSKRGLPLIGTLLKWKVTTSTFLPINDGMLNLLQIISLYGNFIASKISGIVSITTNSLFSCSKKSRKSLSVSKPV